MINDGGPMETDTERRREALVPLSATRRLLASAIKRVSELIW